MTTEPTEKHKEEARDLILSLIELFEFNGHVENVSKGHCPECWNFPDKPSTARMWYERGRVGHKPDCRRGARFKAAYDALDALASRDSEVREVLEGLRTNVNHYESCWCRTSTSVHTPACLAARGLWERVQVDVKKEESNVAE